MYVMLEVLQLQISGEMLMPLDVVTEHRRYAARCSRYTRWQRRL